MRGGLGRAKRKGPVPIGPAPFATGLLTLALTAAAVALRRLLPWRLGLGRLMPWHLRLRRLALRLGRFRRLGALGLSLVPRLGLARRLRPLRLLAPGRLGLALRRLDLGG